MLQITRHAASLIASECSAREMPDTGGLRIALKSSANDRTVRSLAIQYVASPRTSDTVVREGDAAVFLADGVDHMVGTRVLDAEEAGDPPRLVLKPGNRA